MWAKEDIRKQNLSIRRSMTKTQVDDFSVKICKKIASSQEYKACKNILLYAAIKNEVDLSQLFCRSIYDGKCVYYPRTEGEYINFYQVLDLSELVPCHFGVPEPSSDKPKFEGDKGLVIVPGLAFSKRGFRVGYGKGYYDRFLAGNNFTSIGVGYHFQFENDFYEDQHDVAMDIMFSEQGKEL